MATTYTWTITGLKKAPSLNGLDDVVTGIKFKYKGNTGSLWAYSGWWSCKGLGSGRGLANLTKKLKVVAINDINPDINSQIAPLRWCSILFYSTWQIILRHSYTKTKNHYSTNLRHPLRHHQHHQLRVSQRHYLVLQILHIVS